MTNRPTGELERWMTEAEATQMLEETALRLTEASRALEAVQVSLALELGRNERWQSMFEDLMGASTAISLWVKQTYMTKNIHVGELEQVYTLADRIERVAVSYRKRKDLVQGGSVPPEEINDHE